MKYIYLGQVVRTGGQPYKDIKSHRSTSFTKSQMSSSSNAQQSRASSIGTRQGTLPQDNRSDGEVISLLLSLPSHTGQDTTSFSRDGSTALSAFITEDTPGETQIGTDYGDNAIQQPKLVYPLPKGYRP
jgi:hypothetical protein